MTWQKAVFLLLVIFCLTPYATPPVALALGLALAFTVGSPFPQLKGKPTKYLLQGSVVLLGFGMNLSAIYDAGRDGILFTIATIAGTLAGGYLLGRALAVGDKTSALISSGTAICGGSAIAAVGPAIGADSDEMSVSLGTVFVLNSIALFIFPMIGHGLGLTEHQFGIWAAIAIHDTSSVVGASGSYGPEALLTGTTVKLARALWIAPVALMFAWIYRKKGGGAKAVSSMPWFILLFIVAAIIRTVFTYRLFPSMFDALVNLARAGLVMTLFLIGSSLTTSMIRKVGARPLVQGVVLWTAISVISLFAVLRLL